jgi:hypothetical protein
MSTPSPLPSAVEVRELIADLLGRDVVATIGSGAVDPRQPPGGVVGTYVDDALQLKAIIVLDLELAAWMGASIALLSTEIAAEAIETGALTPVLYDNVAEVLNISASLFNLDDAPHVRLYASYAPHESLPADVSKWVLAFVRRLDMKLEVAGYGAGRISVLVI